MNINNFNRTFFGAKIPIKGTLFEKLPDDIIEKIQKPVSASDIQSNFRKYMNSKVYLKNQLFKINAEWEDEEYAREMMLPGGEPWLVLNPTQSIPAKFINNASKILTNEDFEEEEIWAFMLEHILKELLDEDLLYVVDQPLENLTPLTALMYKETRRNLFKTISSALKMLNTIGYPNNKKVINGKEELSYTEIKGKIKKGLNWLQDKWLTGNAFGAIPILAGAAARLGGKKLLGRTASRGFRMPRMPRMPRMRKTSRKYYDYYDNYYDDYYDNYYNFGVNIKSKKNIHDIRKKFYSSLFTNDNSDEISNQIKLRCKNDFNTKHCQSIFTELLISIILSLVPKSIITENRKKILKEIKTYIPRDFKYTKINIKRTHFDKINSFLYILQDHSYGTFNNARLASLIYEFIHNKK